MWANSASTTSPTTRRSAWPKPDSRRRCFRPGTALRFVGDERNLSRSDGLTYQAKGVRRCRRFPDTGRFPWLIGRAWADHKMGTESLGAVHVAADGTFAGVVEVRVVQPNPAMVRSSGPSHAGEKRRRHSKHAQVHLPAAGVRARRHAHVRRVRAQCWWPPAGGRPRPVGTSALSFSTGRRSPP